MKTIKSINQKDILEFIAEKIRKSAPFKAAHAMARKINKGLTYSATFALCLKFVYANIKNRIAQVDSLDVLVNKVVKQNNTGDKIMTAKYVTSSMQAGTSPMETKHTSLNKAICFAQGQLKSGASNKIEVFRESEDGEKDYSFMSFYITES